MFKRLKKPKKYFGSSRNNRIVGKFKLLGWDLPVIFQKTLAIRRPKKLIQIIREERKSKFFDTRGHEKYFNKFEQSLDMVPIKDATDALILQYHLIGQSDRKTSQWLKSAENPDPTKYKPMVPRAVGKRIQKMRDAIKLRKPLTAQNIKPKKRKPKPYNGIPTPLPLMTSTVKIKPIVVATPTPIKLPTAPVIKLRRKIAA